MANTLTALLYDILARSFVRVRERTQLPRYINTDWDSELARFGSTIDVRVSQPRTAKQMTPAATPPAGTDTTPVTVPMVLDQWWFDDFYLDDKEINEIADGPDRTFLPDQVFEAVRAVVNKVVTQTFGHYTGIYGAVGTAGTTPFASDVTDAAKCRGKLFAQLAPAEDRFGLLNNDAATNASGLSNFVQAEQFGSRAGLTEGASGMGRVSGIQWSEDDLLPSHTGGVPGSIVVNGALSVGDTSVVVDGGDASGTVKKGDIMEFAGHTQTYAVTADVTLDGTGAGTIVVTPALVSAVADNEAITHSGDHAVNLAFHRPAFALAMRPMASNRLRSLLGDAAPIQAVLPDAQTGLVLRLSTAREWFRSRWVVDALWGSALIEPRFAVRLMG